MMHKTELMIVWRRATINCAMTYTLSICTYIHFIECIHMSKLTNTTRSMLRIVFVKATTMWVLNEFDVFQLIACLLNILNFLIEWLKYNKSIPINNDFCSKYIHLYWTIYEKQRFYFNLIWFVVIQRAMVVFVDVLVMLTFQFWWLLVQHLLVDSVQCIPNMLRA